MRKRNRILLCAATGVLLVLSFPPMPFFFLAFIAFIPLLYVLDTCKKLYFWSLYLCFFIFHTGTLWWISSFQEQTDPFLLATGFLLDFFHPLFFLLPIILFLVVRIKLPSRAALYSFPFIWTFYEWTHAQTELSFPWLNIGNTQIYNINWVQIADITGVWGVSFVILLANVLIYDLIKNYKAGFTGFYFNKNQYAVLFLLVVFPIVYSNIQLTKYDHDILLKKNETVNIGVIQPNINPWVKWQAGPVDQAKSMMEMSDELLDSIPDIDLMIWPETSVLYINERFNTKHDFSFLKDWVDTSNITLMTGFVDRKYYSKDEEIPAITKEVERNGEKVSYNTFNSALLLNKDTKQVYHKIKLTPFGERVPHAEIFGFLIKFVDWGVGISFWGKGTEQNNLTTEHNDLSIAPIICIESIYPNFVRKFSQKGANLYTVITNDAWYDGTPGPEQHMLIAAMRSIENKRYLARSANSGVSCFISPTGKVLQRAEQYKQTSIALTVPKIEGKTIYSVFGDWFAYLCILLSIYYIIYAIVRKKIEP